MLFTPALYLYPSLRETELELARFAPLGQILELRSLCTFRSKNLSGVLTFLLRCLNHFYPRFILKIIIQTITNNLSFTL